MHGWMQRKAKACCEWAQGQLKPEELLGFVAGRNAESQAAILVGCRGCGQVEIRQRDFFRALGREIPECLADDGVVSNLLLALIAEDKNCGGRDRGSLRICARRGARRGSRTRVRIAIAIGLFLAEHLLFFEALLVHIVGRSAVALVVFVI